MDALSNVVLEPRPHFRVLPTPKKSEDPRLWDVDERNSVGFIIEDKTSSKGPYRTHVAFQVRTGKEHFMPISFVLEAEPSKIVTVKGMKVGGQSASFDISGERPLSIRIPVVGGKDPQSIELKVIKDVKARSGSSQILFKMANETERGRSKEGRESFDFGSLLDLDVYEESGSEILTSSEGIKGYGLLPLRERNSPNQIHFRDYFVSSTQIPRPLPGKQTINQLSSELEKELGAGLDTSIRDYVRDKIERGDGRLYNFQARAIKAISHEVRSQRRPCIITARTATGKTEAFLIPIVNWILESNSTRKLKGVKALFFYPTKALASDQLQRIVELIFRVNEAHQSNPITIGVYHGDIEERLTLDIPLPVRCVLHEDDIQSDRLQPSEVRLIPEAGTMIPKCKKCGVGYPFLLIDRYNVTLSLPDILICTPDAINYALMRDSRRHVFFGAQKTVQVCANCRHVNFTPTNKCEKCGAPVKQTEIKPETGLQIAVLDELHLFSSLFGGNVSNFLRRLVAAVSAYGSPGSKRIQFVATSATVRNPVEFGQDFFGTSIISIETTDEDYDFKTGLAKVLVFATPRAYRMIDTVSYSLYEILKSTEIRFLVFIDSKKLCSMLLGKLRQRLSADPKTEKLVDQVDGHNSSYTRQERADSEEKFNAGKIRVLVATSTLEVGVDFKNLDGMAIFGAPYGFNNYLQRIGRAGRKSDALVINFLSSTDPIDVYYYRNAISFSNDPTQFIEQPPFPSNNALLSQKHVLATMFDTGEIFGLDVAVLLKAFRENWHSLDSKVQDHLRQLWKEDDINQASSRLKQATTAVMNDAQLPEVAIKKFNLLNLRKVDETVKVEFEEPSTSRYGSHTSGTGFPRSGRPPTGGSRLRSDEEREIVRRMRGGS